MQLQTIKGTARDLRHSAQTTLVGKAGKLHRRRCEFRMGSTAIRVQSHRPLLIEEGSNVAVAGRMRRDHLQAWAWRNLGTGEEGDAGWRGSMIAGLLFCLAAPCVLAVFPLPVFAWAQLMSWIPLLLAALCFALGMTLLVQGARICSAAHWLSKARR